MFVEAVGDSGAAQKSLCLSSKHQLGAAILVSYLIVYSMNIINIEIEIHHHVTQPAVNAFDIFFCGIKMTERSIIRYIKLCVL